MCCKLKFSSQIKSFGCEEVCWASAALHADSIVGRLSSSARLCGSSNDEFISDQMVLVSLLLLGGVLFVVP